MAKKYLFNRCDPSQYDSKPLKSKKKGTDLCPFDEYYVFGAEYTLSAPWNLCYNRYKVRVNDISVSFNW
jgi:hypothetical protein